MYRYYSSNNRFLIEHLINLVEVGVPPIITALSFLLSLVMLYSPSPVALHGARQRASRTIAIFTGLFLLCNLPFFLLLCYNTWTKFFPGGSYPGPILSPPLMFWYAWNVAKVGAVVLNAALNPLLYYYRMVRFRSWVVVLCSEGRERRDTGAGDVTATFHNGAGNHGNNNNNNQVAASNNPAGSNGSSSHTAAGGRMSCFTRPPNQVGDVVQAMCRRKTEWVQVNKGDRAAAVKKVSILAESNI